jgi:hypothetical protein
MIAIAPAGSSTIRVLHPCGHRFDREKRKERGWGSCQIGPFSRPSLARFSFEQAIEIRR